MGGSIFSLLLFQFVVNRSHLLIEVFGSSQMSLENLLGGLREVSMVKSRCSDEYYPKLCSISAHKALLQIYQTLFNVANLRV